MDGANFDSLTRIFARKATRRRLLGATAAIGAAAIVPIRFHQATAQSNDAVSVVQQFYEAIDAYDYNAAYALYGSSMQSQQTAAQFEQGYVGTAFVQMTTSGSKQNANGGTDVSVDLISWLNDGGIHAYSGTYTVVNQLITGANITQENDPGGVAPLCDINQLSFALGPWSAGAGNRFSSVEATNTSNASCVVGGSPRIIINDATDGSSLQSVSVTGSAPVGITLNPGSTAHAPFQFSNWCVSEQNQISLAVEVAGDTAQGTIDTSANGITYPPCLGEGQDPVLNVQGFVTGPV
jgi:hypothetical protein